MNKSVKRLVSVLLAAAVLCALGVSALADGEATYTVRLYAGSGGLDTEAGQKAAFADGANVLSVQCSYGDPFPFSVDGLNESMTFDEKYYVKCIRPSGHDNNTIESVPLTVTEDADYVVGYGIRGQLVAYTVNYIDAAGNALAPSQMYFGNVGDKPVVAYLYIDGYEPQAYNLAKTLLDDEGQNVIDFVYTPVVVPTPIPAAPAPTPYVYTEGAAGGGAAGGAGAGEAAGGAAAGGGLPAGAGAAELPGAGGEEAVAGENVPEAGAPEEGGEPAAAETQNEPAAEEQNAPAQEPETAQIEEEQAPQASGPQEIIDLDEEDTPLGGAPEVKEKPQTELQKEREQSERKFYIAAGLLGVSLIAIVALVVALVRRRKA